jgi:hypothetical protein
MMRGLKRACMHLIVLGLMILWHGQAAVAAPLGSLVQAAGLRDIGEPQPAVDFQLSDLDGQLLHLQDQRGKVCCSISGPPGVIPVCKKCH